MKVTTSEFVTSAAAVANLPRDDLPHLVFVGRSNVGKSSLINALVRRKVARTSAAAGKTRLINLYRVVLAGTKPSPMRSSGPAAGSPPVFHGRLYLVDAPGYGYARGGEPSARAFEALTEDYFAYLAAAARSDRVVPRAAGAILAVDARHPGLGPDVLARDWLGQIGLPFAVVTTKVDQVRRTARQRQQLAAESALRTSVLPVSTVTGEGLNELWKLIIRLTSR